MVIGYATFDLNFEFGSFTPKEENNYWTSMQRFCSS